MFNQLYWLYCLPSQTQSRLDFNADIARLPAQNVSSLLARASLSCLEQSNLMYITGRLCSAPPNQSACLLFRFLSLSNKNSFEVSFFFKSLMFYKSQTLKILKSFLGFKSSKTAVTEPSGSGSMAMSERFACDIHK